MNMKTANTRITQRRTAREDDGYTTLCIYAKAQMRALGYAVTLCGDIVTERDAQRAKRITGGGTQRNNVVHCPICYAVFSDDAFREEKLNHIETNVLPHMRADETTEQENRQ